MNSLPEKYRNDIAIIKETAQQIVRDFNLEGFEIIFSGNDRLAFEELKSQIIPVIKRRMKEDKQSFFSLLYRIDIPEKEYKMTLNEKSSLSFEERLSEAVIRREFQKVITRRFFSEKDPGK